jgi:hypothetical protein
MTEAGSTLSRHDLEAKIVKRCWENEAFRREFTADPSGAFTKYLEIPATYLPKIVVHEEPAGSWHIVLPPRPGNIGQLSEADLERVTGGTDPPMPISAKVTIAIAAAASLVASGGATLYGAKQW